MQKYVLMMTRAVIIFKNTCLILELQKSEGLQNEDFLSILQTQEITKKWIEIRQIHCHYVTDNLSISFHIFLNHRFRPCLSI